MIEVERIRGVMFGLVGEVMRIEKVRRCLRERPSVCIADEGRDVIGRVHLSVFSAELACMANIVERMKRKLRWCVRLRLAKRSGALVGIVSICLNARLANLMHTSRSGSSIGIGAGLTRSSRLASRLMRLRETMTDGLYVIWLLGRHIASNDTIWLSSS